MHVEDVGWGHTSPRTYLLYLEHVLVPCLHAVCLCIYVAQYLEHVSTMLTCCVYMDDGSIHTYSL